MNHRSKANQTRHTKQGWKLSSIKEIKYVNFEQWKQKKGNANNNAGVNEN